MKKKRLPSPEHVDTLSLNALRNLVTGLAGQVNALTSEVRKLRAENVALREENAELRLENVRLKVDNQMLRDEIARLKKPSAETAVQAFGHGPGNGWQKGCQQRRQEEAARGKARHNPRQP